MTLQADPEVPKGLGYFDAGEDSPDDASTGTEQRRPCAQPGCTDTWVKRPGDHPRRTKCDKHYQGKPPRPAGTAGKDSEPADAARVLGSWSLEDAISLPLTKVERELASRIELLVRMSSGLVYRMNVTDSLIISSHASSLAEGLVIEARTSEQLAKMVHAMATFAGSGPLAIVVTTMALEIAANHRVPVIGDMVKVPDDIKDQAARIAFTREVVRNRKPPMGSPEPAPPASGNVVRECSLCQRRVVGLAGSLAVCLCGQAVTL